MYFNIFSIVQGFVQNTYIFLLYVVSYSQGDMTPWTCYCYFDLFSLLKITFMKKQKVPPLTALTTGRDISLPLLHAHSIIKACGYLFPKCLSNLFLSAIPADVFLVHSNVICQLDHCNNFITHPCPHSPPTSILCVLARVVVPEYKSKMTFPCLKSLNGFV